VGRPESSSSSDSFPCQYLQSQLFWQSRCVSRHHSGEVVVARIGILLRSASQISTHRDCDLLSIFRSFYLLLRFARLFWPAGCSRACVFLIRALLSGTRVPSCRGRIVHVLFRKASLSYRNAGPRSSEFKRRERKICLQFWELIT
jgi:hypothetical protein